MLTTDNISLRYGKRVLFEDVNLKFTAGHCYGVIGANGAGKSTFLKILSGEIDPNSGSVHLDKGKRMAVLSQDHFAYDNETVLNTVLQGHSILWDLMQEKDTIYAKDPFTDEDGLLAADLEEKFAEMNGWNAESDAGNLLDGLGISTDLHYRKMDELNGNQKVRVLLAQALFGDPDVLLMDEPTNDLDVETISWLENFLADFKNTVLVVSHDRHFLDAVCTNVVDIDFNKINVFTGNYSFWYHSSQLALRQKTDQNKKSEEKKKELQDFIARFSANAAKSKQATSRKKLLEKLNIEDIKPSTRRYPAIMFNQERDAGDQIINISNLSAENDEGVLFSNVEFSVNKGDKIAIISKNSLAITTFFKTLVEEHPKKTGEVEWGITINKSYLPNDNSKFFDNNLSLVDWLRQYSDEKDETFIRGFLGKMLFSGEESLKESNVLSGGEKVRCMFSKIMLECSNLMIMDEPTNHLDLESIQALNNGLLDYKGTLLFYSHDHEVINSVANRIIEIGPNGMVDKQCTFDEYRNDKSLKERKSSLYV